MSHSNFQKPARRHGMVAHWCQWNPDGTIRRVEYHPERDAKREAATQDQLL